jgi:ATP-dependent DNA ligase
MVGRDGSRVRCFTRNGHDWATRFLAIVEAAARFKAQSFLIDGEVVIARDDGMPDFQPFRSQRRGSEAVLFAFDLIEHDGDELRHLPVIDRKRRLAKLVGKTKRPVACDGQNSQRLESAQYALRSQPWRARETPVCRMRPPLLMKA